MKSTKINEHEQLPENVTEAEKKSDDSQSLIIVEKLSSNTITVEYFVDLY